MIQVRALTTQSIRRCKSEFQSGKSVIGTGKEEARSTSDKYRIRSRSVQSKTGSGQSQGKAGGESRSRSVQSKIQSPAPLAQPLTGVQPKIDTGRGRKRTGFDPTSVSVEHPASVEIKTSDRKQIFVRFFDVFVQFFQV